MEGISYYSCENVRVLLKHESGEEVEVKNFSPGDFIKQLLGNRLTVLTVPIFSGVYDFCEKFEGNSVKMKIEIPVKENSVDKVYVKEVEGKMSYSLRVGVDDFPEIRVEIDSGGEG